MFIKEMTTEKPETFYGKEAERNTLMTPLIRIRWTLRSLWCLIFGHRMVRQKWVHKKYGESADYEWHEGCTRCPKWRTYPHKL